jgi:isocitrate/isopropylmalate dehydrogenase
MPRVAVIPGDDAAPEAMSATLRVLDALAPPVDWDVLPVGSELARLEPAEREKRVHERINAADSVLFGSTNGTTPGILHMRWGRETYANVRPIRWRPGFRSPLARPEGIDYVIVRENLEDLYVGVMGPLEDLLRAGLPGPHSRLPRGRDGRYAAKIITREGTERVARFACELALRRRGRLTVSAKTNMLPATDRWFCEIAREIAAEYPGLVFEQFIVDDMAHRLVSAPHELDVLLLPNLYGDVLSDEGAATLGGLGLAPSGCYGEGFAYFESAHGTAPDLAGQGRINPTATLLSAVLLLEHLGLEAFARRLDAAVSRVYAEGRTLTRDQGGTASTEAFADAVIAALR